MWAVVVPASMIQAPPDLGLSGKPVDSVVAPGTAMVMCVRALAGTVDISFAKLIRGPASLGGLLQQRGTRSVPSTADPDPDGGAYFSGGYNTKRHGSRDGGTISGIQMEHHFPGLRDTEQNRNAYATMLPTRWSST